MSTKKKKLISCDICEKPFILYGGGLDTSSSSMVQGPQINAGVKNWCTGRCDAVIIPLALEIDEVEGVAKKAKSKAVRTFAKEVAKHLKRILKEQRKNLKDME